MSKVTLKGVQKIDAKSQSSSVGGDSGFSLEINDKELLVLAGPAGSGKSTLLRLIAGLEEISRGEILIGEKKVDGLPAGEREIALVPELGALFEGRTVRENLAFGMNLRKVPAKEIERRVKEAASILGLEAVLEKTVSEVSAIDGQRTALGRAIVRQPKILLLDAPFCKFTSSEQALLRAELIRIHERLQATILYATAAPMEALALGSRIAVINEGTLQQIDTPSNIYALPANSFVAGYFGTPAMNLVLGTLKRAGESLQFREQGEGTIECKLGDPTQMAILGEYTGKEVILGLRPEHISPAFADSPAKGRIKGLVDLIEPRGAETLLHLQTGAHNLVARSDSFLDRGEAGHRMQFELDLSSACFFDPGSTLRIYPK